MHSACALALSNISISQPIALLSAGPITTSYTKYLAMSSRLPTHHMHYAELASQYTELLVVNMNDETKVTNTDCTDGHYGHLTLKCFLSHGESS